MRRPGRLGSARLVAAAVLVAVALTVLGCGGGSGGGGAPPSPLAREIVRLADRMEELHPALFASVSRERFRTEATELAARADGLTRDELVVGLMRLTALPGERNGHTGIYPLHPSHTTPLRLYPLRLYDFADGLHVVAGARPGLVGRRLVAIEGIPVAELVERVRLLVPRDNDSTVRWLLPEYLVTAEVLRGLGVVDDSDATFSFSDGSSVRLAPIDAGTYAAEPGGAPAPLPAVGNPLWLRRLDQQHWLTTLERGRVVYLGYRVTLGSTRELSERLRRLARRPGVRRVVVDVRLNHGGDNTTYGPLFEALAAPVIDRPGRLVVLLGRGTFSAAGSFVADLARFTGARFLGEASGGAPNQWGDASEVALPRAGLTVQVATSYEEYAPGSMALATGPDVPLEPRAADYFAGRDPVLARALRVGGR